MTILLWKFYIIIQKAYSHCTRKTLVEFPKCVYNVYVLVKNPFFYSDTLFLDF